jgi:NACHT domain
MAEGGSWPARAAFLATVVGPPLVAAGVWRSFVAANPLAAIIVVVIYEALVGLLRFSGQVVGDLKDRWEPRLVDHVDNAMRRRISGFGSRYREFVLETLKYIDQKGLETVGFYTPQLDEVFVDVSLARRPTHQMPTDLLANSSTEPTERMIIDQFLDQQQAVVLAVVGAPGGGKTTLLRHVARNVCRGDRGQRRKVPILLYLRDYATTIHTTFSVNVAELVLRWLAQSQIEEPRGWFEQQLRNGNCVILLDGLDEVANQHHRRSVSDWVTRQVQMYPKNDFVITSRPDGYRSAPIHGAIVLNVLPFAEKQVSQFVLGWYRAVEKAASSDDAKDSQLRADSAAEDLLDRLNRAPALFELTVNPLLLTMIVNVHRYRGVLPGSRVKLYHEICQVMLGLRQEAKKLALDLDGDHKEALLRSLAYLMMRKNISDMPKADVIAELKPALRRVSRSLEVQDFLADVASNGLLVERETDSYSFAHLTFQEYLTAMHIRSKGLSKVLTDVVGDSWWRETTLLYTAQADADSIVRACLNAATVAAVALAFDCTEQGSELAPELRDYLDNLLNSAYAPATKPELRRLMAGVLVTRHLRHLVRVGSTSRVCVEPITADLYWLFEQDLPGHEPDRLAVVTPGMDNRPITGVRSADVIAFIRWVNGITGSAFTCRLPTREEVQDSTVRRALARSADSTALAVWLAAPDGGTEPVLWSSSATHQPHEIPDATVVKHLQHDVEALDGTMSRLLLVHAVVSNQVLGFVLNRTLGLAMTTGLTHMPVLDTAMQQARVSETAIRRYIRVSAAVDSMLRPICGLTHSCDVDAAFRMAASVRIDLGQTYGVDAISRFLDNIDIAEVESAAYAVVGKTVMGRISLIDQALALDTIVALDFEHLLDSSADAPTSMNEALAINPYQAFVGTIGSALARVTAENLYYGASRREWQRGFVKSFIDMTKVTRNLGRVHLIPPELLADKVRYVCSAVIGLEGLAGNTWVSQVARNVVEIAIPPVERAAPVTAEWATAVRLGALCLAVETEVQGARELGNLLREVAAGVTLLERRHSGQSEPTESILLATS